jgi:hypothetical protein
MKDVEKTGDDENGSSVKNVKVYLGSLDNAERTGGIFDDAVQWSKENKTATEIENNDPPFPGDCDDSTLTGWSFENTGVDDV